MAADRLPLNIPPLKTFTSPLRHYIAMWWCVFVAVMPVVMTRFGLIPVYESQRSLLPAYASFFCLLALAYVFSQRHRMARAMFAAQLLWGDLDPNQTKASKGISISGALPGMILGALSCAAIYLWAFESGRTSRDFPTLPPSSMNAVLLALSYITLFLLASAAFAVVAVREHMQHVLGLSDAEVIRGLPRGTAQMTSAAPPEPRHGAIAVLSERTGARLSSGRGQEQFNVHELFPAESDVGAVLSEVDTHSGMLGPDAQ